MEFYITEDTVNSLCNLCQSSKDEQSGIMTFKKDNFVFYFQNYALCDEQDIELCDEKCIYVSDEYKKRIVLEMNHANELEGVIVRFHTHPSEYEIAYPSLQDKEFIRNMQKLVNITNKLLLTNFVYVEGIITHKDIGFYYLNKMNNKIERIKLFTENREIIPSKLINIKKIKMKDLTSAFANGFKSGFNINKY